MSGKSDLQDEPAEEYEALTLGCVKIRGIGIHYRPSDCRRDRLWEMTIWRFERSGNEETWIRKTTPAKSDSIFSLRSLLRLDNLVKGHIVPKDRSLQRPCYMKDMVNE